MPDLFLGDYFHVTINTSYNANEQFDLMIVDYNTVLNRVRSAASSRRDQPHIALMPRNHFVTEHKMNATNTTNGGFDGSYMSKTVLPAYETALNTALRGYLMTFDDWRSNSINNGDISARYKRLTLPTEEMITGVSKMSYAAQDCCGFTKQLAFFRLDPFNFTSNWSNGCRSYWLQNIASSTEFVTYNDYGGCQPRAASNEYYIKPIMFMC